MKTKTLLITVALGLGAVTAFAQDAGPTPPPGGPGPGPRGPRQPPPIIEALDANKDGRIDASEIANAANALKALDANGDGELTHDEFAGGRPGQRGGFGRGPGSPGAGRRLGPPAQE